MAADTATKQRIAARIVDLRGQSGMNQKQLAEALAIDPSSMNRIEKGERAISVAELIRLAGVFGVSAENLVRAEESSGVLFRIEGPRNPAVDESLDLFRGVITDYFGAQATVG
jgi:transcriptional regulator with XRE-family HTH domain